MESEPLFFSNFESLIRISITVPVLYLAVVVFIRVSGKRSTSQMNNFDWIVTVALGSIVASGILLKDVPLADSVLAILLLLGFQYGVTKLVRKSKVVAKLVRAEPTVLVQEGRFQDREMAQERITEDEVYAAIRNDGFTKLAEVDQVILETDATFSVSPKQSSQS